MMFNIMFLASFYWSVIVPGAVGLGFRRVLWPLIGAVIIGTSPALMFMVIVALRSPGEVLDVMMNFRFYAQSGGGGRAGFVVGWWLSLLEYSTVSFVAFRGIALLYRALLRREKRPADSPSNERE